MGYKEADEALVQARRHYVASANRVEFEPRRTAMQLRYVIKFVAQMDKAVAFHRDALGLSMKFQSPEWTEFATGATTLALHPADEAHPAGSCQLGFGTDQLDALFEEREKRGIAFTMPPTAMHGQRMARFHDLDGAETSIAE